MSLRALSPGRSTILHVVLCVLGSGCRQTYVDADNDRIPVAIARAVDASGVSVDSTANDDLGPIYPFDGEAVEVKLDGSASSDMDGNIVSYRWLGTSVLDGGAGRTAPEGEASDWPDDVKRPIVMLGEGSWSFSLWVTDDSGAISNPSEIHLIIGEAPEIDAGPPKVMCMGVTCDPMVTLTGATEPSQGCCDMDSGGACGVVVDTMGACEAVDQPGTDDPSCPSAMSAAGTTIAGCCKPDGKCGVRSGVLRGCIERTDYPPAFVMSMMQLTAADCGRN